MLIGFFKYDEVNSILLSGSDDKSVKIFDVRCADCIQTVQFNDSVGNLYYHDKMLLTVIKREGNLYWYDLRTNSLVTTLDGHTKAVRSF